MSKNAVSVSNADTNSITIDSQIVGSARGIAYTNRFGLPDAFVRAVLSDPYNNGGADFSATGLQNPPRATALIERFKNEIEVDVSSRVASIIGQGAHSIAERAARPGIDLCEKRLFGKFEVDGRDYIVSAQVDLFETDTGNLLDWKTCKAYAFSKKAGGGVKPEWVEQLNIGAELLRQNGHDPKKLTIIAMLKDWNKREAGSAGMPKSEVVEVNIPMLHRETVTKNIKSRIKAHMSARENLPRCTSQETWNGNRCSGGWCDAASVCEQFKDAQKTGLMTTVGEK